MNLAHIEKIYQYVNASVLLVLELLANASRLSAFDHTLSFAVLTTAPQTNLQTLQFTRSEGRTIFAH